MARAFFTMFSSFPYQKHCFQGQFLFSRWKLCLLYTAGNFHANPNMRARASEQSSNSYEQLEQRPNFASTQIEWAHSIPLNLNMIFHVVVQNLKLRPSSLMIFGTANFETVLADRPSTSFPGSLSSVSRGRSEEHGRQMIESPGSQAKCLRDVIRSDLKLTARRKTCN